MSHDSIYILELYITLTIPHAIHDALLRLTHQEIYHAIVLYYCIENMICDIRHNHHRFASSYLENAYPKDNQVYYYECIHDNYYIFFNHLVSRIPALIPLF